MNPAEPSLASRPSGVVKPQTVKWHGQLAAFLIAALLRLLGWTLRKRWHDAGGIFRQTISSPLIFALWHNRLGIADLCAQKVTRNSRPGARVAALISASRDGGLLARTVEWLGMTPVRGSSSRRGAQALKELSTRIRKGDHAAVTPDGPRGPRYNVQEGVLALAQLTGAPIIPVSAHLRWKVSLKSWDGFQIPLPFSRCDLYFGRPIPVPRDCSETARAALRDQLERELREMTVD